MYTLALPCLAWHLSQTGLQHLHEQLVHGRAALAMHVRPEASHGYVSVTQRRQYEQQLLQRRVAVVRPAHDIAMDY